MGLIKTVFCVLWLTLLLTSSASGKHSTVIWKELANKATHKTPNTQLLAAALAASTTFEPAAREIALEAALGALARETPTATFLKPLGTPAERLPRYTALWIELSSQRMKTNARLLNELVHALLHEQERRRAHCRNQTARTLTKIGRLPATKKRAAAWNALADTRVTCGETQLSLIAKQHSANEEKLRLALLGWKGLESFCSGIGDVVKNLTQWPPEGRANAIDRRCRPPGITLESVSRTPPMALLFTYAIAHQLGKQNLLTSAHLKILAMTR